MAEYIDIAKSYDMETLDSWYIASVTTNDEPVWTEEHLEELLNDFYVIPKDTPATDVVEVVRCKDCYKRATEDCPMDDGWTANTIFCSYGERRTEDGEI